MCSLNTAWSSICSDVACPRLTDSGSGAVGSCECPNTPPCLPPLDASLQMFLEERLAPLAFLYLLHPHAPTATAAHQLFCALLVALLPEARREPLAAYYVQRCLEGCPGPTPLPQFGQGLATVLHALPVGSPVPLLCLERVLDRCQQLAPRCDSELLWHWLALAADWKLPTAGRAPHHSFQIYQLLPTAAAAAACCCSQWGICGTRAGGPGGAATAAGGLFLAGQCH